MTHHPEVDGLPESVPQAAASPLAAHLTESGLCFHWADDDGPVGPVYDKPVFLLQSL